MSDENRPEPTKTFKPKNYARIYGSCKGEKFSDNVKWAPCKHCGVMSRKKKCQFCGTERGEKPTTKEQQVRLIGNSVCPPVAAALVAANYAKPKAEEFFSSAEYPAAVSAL